MYRKICSHANILRVMMMMMMMMKEPTNFLIYAACCCSASNLTFHAYIVLTYGIPPDTVLLVCRANCACCSSITRYRRIVQFTSMPS